jgi:alpha-L-fucosidase
MHARDLHVGLYYSHNDWNHPDYPTLHAPPSTPGGHPGHRYSFASGPEEPDRWANFIRFHRLQLRELCELYSPDLLWFDGDWERNWQQWDFEQLNQQLRTWRPGVVINSRIGPYGDYDTPEQAIPTVPPGRPWELCLTLNRSWSMATDPSYKPVGELIRTLAECAGMGGNLLLNVAPLSDGTIFYEQARLLREIGA